MIQPILPIADVPDELLRVVNDRLRELDVRVGPGDGTPGPPGPPGSAGVPGEDGTPGTGDGTAPPAPNITSATVVPRYSCPFNDSMYDLLVTVSLFAANIADLKKIRVKNSLTGADMLVIAQPATGWTTTVAVPTDLFPQTRALQSGTATFNCENADGVVTASPVVVAFTVQASAVTGFTSAAEVGARLITYQDATTRLVTCTVGFVPILNGGQVPQSVYYLLSKDNGSTWTGINFQRMTAVGNRLDFYSLAPGVDQSWKVAACTGALPAVSVAITAANIATLFPGVQISAAFSVVALQLPPANLISTITIPAGTSAAPYPYDAVRANKSRYWKIPTISVSDLGAINAPDAFFLRVTAQDLDISHNAVAPEQPFAGDQVSPKGQTNVYGPLMGEYGLDGITIKRTGNIAFVRLRVYLCNRVDGTSLSFKNTLCATLQTAVGGGVGYIDVQVSDGTIPPVSIDGSTTFPDPQVTINSAAVRQIYENQFEVSVFWTPTATSVADAFRGVSVFLEDPDTSEGGSAPLAGTVKLDGTSQASGTWTPIQQNDSYQSPAVILVDGSAASRKVRIYTQAFGTASNAKLQRANRPNPSPSIQVVVPAKSDSYGSGLEYAWLITNPVATVVKDFDNPAGPYWWLTFGYTKPDASIPLPPGMKEFGGAVTFFERNNDGNYQLNQFLDVLDVNHTSWKTERFAAGAGDAFRVWFASRDIDGRVNKIVPGFTPYADVVVVYPPVGESSAPYITGLTLSNYRHEPQPDGTDIARVDLSWLNPTSPRFASVEFLRTGVTPPRSMRQPSSPPVSSVTLDVIDWPKTASAWTIVAISRDFNGKASDSAATPGPSTPSVLWNIGPPTLGTPGGGIEYTPIGGVSAVTITTEQQPGGDGIQQMRHKISGWTNPTDNTFGGMSIARVYPIGDYANATWWDPPKGATSFTTDWEPAPTSRTFDFFFVSRDMQGRINSISAANTPKVSHVFTLVPGQLLTSRLPRDWFDEAEFSWPAGGLFVADQFAAKKIYVGSILRVGGGTTANVTDPSFAGQQNGQIAVYSNGNVLRAWMGQQTATSPGDTVAHTVFGGWFAELYVGGDNPTNAPIFTNQTGQIFVGGFAGAPGSGRYPYISIRDAANGEVGRMGANIGWSQGGIENTIQGAWFRDLAFGGQNFTDWRFLSKTDGTVGGTTVQIRQVNKFTIDYAANYAGSGLPNGTNASNHLEFGYDAFVTDNPGDSSYYKFPGIALYRNNYDVVNNPKHGIAIINRGIILRGPFNVGGNLGRVISLVSYNGDPKGSDAGSVWWGDLSMHSYGNGAVNVQLNSGNSVDGSSSFILKDAAGTTNFSVGTTGNVTIRGTLTMANLTLSGNLNVTGSTTLAGASATSMSVFGLLNCQTINTNTYAITVGDINAAGHRMDIATVVSSGIMQASGFNPTGLTGQTVNIAFRDHTTGALMDLFVNGVNQGAIQLVFKGGVVTGWS